MPWSILLQVYVGSLGHLLPLNSCALRNTSNEQTHLTSTLVRQAGVGVGLRRRLRQDAAILVPSISFTVCHCFRRTTDVACVCAGWRVGPGWRVWSGWGVWANWHVRLRPSSGIRPNTGTHVSRAGGEVISGGARGHGDDTVLVALQHDLGVSGSGIPELHPSVLGP